MLDPMSAINPATVGGLDVVSTALTSTAMWAATTTPAGDGSFRQQRFPLAVIGGPVPKSPFSFAVSYSSYLVRDYAMVSRTVDAPRGMPVGVVDSIGATGGVNDFRVAGSITISPELAVGLGAHLMTGASSSFSRRVWDDSSYLPTRQTAEVTHAGGALSAGVVFVPSERLSLAASVRLDGNLSVERDSARIDDLDMPTTFALGARYLVAPKVALSGSAIARTWGDTDRSVVARGGIGAMNTIEYGVGIELVRNVRRPDHKPLRAGVRYATLPFLIEAGRQPTEMAFAVGTGLRFADDLGGIDIALEHFRRSQGSSFRESGWQFTVGVSARGTPSRR